MALLQETKRATFDGSRDWLFGLVETLDSVERLSDVPCDDSAMRAMRARLARPTTTRSASNRFSQFGCSRSPAVFHRG
ncbi:hypothetical protein FNL55_14185 [Tardiphaga sp. vice352]|uniref:hypothetical protein n=1 Tax=unclassified Tardiphaga TaxID=2631404 RepID=UPI00116291B1|nr:MULTISPECIES: hypothetical protein [unclassified Tardiphaga]MBC7585053.1 hypothetical protein [Tardiphaga sp.]QDM17012.1 hypothetical protein FNL53_14470 [Tardiphaga sp. vice278]QDM21993.1 hypothetical protein FIU28_13130 [Tardiphaga sp. vice154]QDM27247.1 hypothetical protein FNL56_14785 [Tardiphaga sp. vice304]QDM32372.1 hypothetical protein FNL55_14185 [Tardiphaga sp. vice352]